MTSAPHPATSSATLTLADEREAQRVAAALEQRLDTDDMVIAAFERADRRWEVTLHFATAPDEAAIRAAVAAAAGDDAAAATSFRSIAAQDWVAASLEGLAPVAAARFVVHGRHDRARVAANRLGIEIEAALAFGTGHHGTTRGCLLLLDRVLKQRAPRRILDLGSGTGVLAIAAAKAARRRVLASDIDQASAIIARENAILNGVGDLIESICARGFAAPQIRMRAPFDLVLANILANPLRQMAPALARHLAPGGVVILSGLLPHQAAGVIATYRGTGLVLVTKLEVDGWSSLLLRRPG